MNAYYSIGKYPLQTEETWPLSLNLRFENIPTVHRSVGLFRSLATEGVLFGDCNRGSSYPLISYITYKLRHKFPGIDRMAGSSD